MGNLTPNPNMRHMKIKFTSNSEKNKLLMQKKDELPDRKKRYKNIIMRNKAPNWVQKNIK